MKNWIRSTLLTLLLPTGVLGTLLVLNKNGFFDLEKIEIVITKNSDQSRFMKPLLQRLDTDLEKVRGLSLWELPLDEIEKKLKSEAWIHSSQIRRSWPNALEIQIEAKSVEALFVGKGGKLFPILEDGTFLDPMPAEALPDVVLIRGEMFLKEKNLLNRAIALLREIPRDGSFSRNTLSELSYDSREGFQGLTLQNGIRVKLGEDDFYLKARRVSQVIDYLVVNRLDARVIDANLTKKVLVRLRKDP